MNWENVLDEIQSPSFDAVLNVVSSTNGFFQAVEEHQTVREALHQMLDSGEVREDVIGRIYDLTNREIDRNFENPHDTALAVLLWLMHYAANDNVQVAATYVDQAPQCWYAKKLAQRVLNPPPSPTRNLEISPEPRLTQSASGRAEIPPIMERPVDSSRNNPKTIPTTNLSTFKLVGI